MKPTILKSNLSQWFFLSSNSVFGSYTFCLNPTVKIDVIHGCIPTYGGSDNAVMPTYKFEKKTFYSSVINLE